MATSQLTSEITSLKVGREVLLSDTGFTAPAGHVTILLGESGSGKTSLLRALMGWQGPSLAGATSVQFDGSDSRLDTLRTAGRIGYVAQDAGLFPWMTVREVVTLPTRLNGHLSGRSDADYRPLLEDVHLRPAILDQRISELSFGMRQRVVLLRALLYRPSLLLIDELFTGLDRTTGEALGALLLRFVRSQSIICVAATHDWFQASLVSKRAMRIDGRKLAAVDLAPALPGTGLDVPPNKDEHS